MVSYEAGEGHQINIGGNEKLSTYEEEKNTKEQPRESNGG